MTGQDSMEPGKPFDSERYVEAASAAIGLPIPPQLHAEVVASFAQMAGTAAFVMALPVGEAIDPAVVYRP